jgi:MFS family permease
MNAGNCAHQIPTKTPDPPNELAGGWQVLVTTCIGLACSSAVLPMYSIGAFVKPLEATFAWSRAEIQASTVFALSLGGLSAPLVGQIIDRHGTRNVVVVGLIGVSIGFALVAFMTSTLWQYYCAYAAIAVLGAGTSAVSWTRVIAATFARQRALALGLALTGTGVSALIAPIFAVWLIQSYGWRMAYAGLALLPVVVALPLVLRNFPVEHRTTPSSTQPQTPQHAPSLSLHGLTTAEAVRSYRFWILAISIACIYLGVTGVAPNLIPALTDRGLTPRAAASAVSAYGISIILGRVAIGWLMDRFWAPGIAALALTPSALACLIFMNGSSYPELILAASLVGLAAGAELNMLAYLVTRYFGMRHYGRTYGLLYCLVSISAGIGPVAFARVYDLTKSYDVSFGIAAILFGIGGPILLCLARYPPEHPTSIYQRA